MSARIDGELDDRARTRFDRHIVGCRRCAQVLDSLRRTLGLLRAERDTPLPAMRSVASDVLALTAHDSVDGSGASER